MHVHKCTAKRTHLHCVAPWKSVGRPVLKHKAIKLTYDKKYTYINTFSEAGH